MLPAEEMSGPQMDELWKKRKKIPKKRTMIGSTWVRVKSAYLECWKNGDSLLVTHKNESNKIAQTIWHRFPVQFLLLLQVMCSVLLSVLPVKTDYLRDADWLLKYPTNQQKGYEKVTQTKKRSTPPERALKTKLETRVRLFVLFCLTHFLCDK